MLTRLIFDRAIKVCTQTLIVDFDLFNIQSKEDNSLIKLKIVSRKAFNFCKSFFRRKHWRKIFHFPTYIGKRQGRFFTMLALQLQFC
jgi:hypothetical protein